MGTEGPTWERGQWPELVEGGGGLGPGDHQSPSPCPAHPTPGGYWDPRGRWEEGDGTPWPACALPSRPWHPRGAGRHHALVALQLLPRATSVTDNLILPSPPFQTVSSYRAGAHLVQAKFSKNTPSLFPFLPPSLLPFLTL